MSENYLDYEAISVRMNVPKRVLIVYQSKANRHRDSGHPRPSDMPPPDNRFGKTPVWKESTIEDWLEHRPGSGWRKGHGGARYWPKGVPAPGRDNDE